MRRIPEEGTGGQLGVFGQELMKIAAGCGLKQTPPSLNLEQVHEAQTWVEF